MLYYFALLSLLMSFLLAIYNWKVQKNALYIAGILLIISVYGLSKIEAVGYIVDDLPRENALWR